MKKKYLPYLEKQILPLNRLPEGAYFINDVADQLDLSEIANYYERPARAPCDPWMVV